ncbi:hypothetical protein MCA2666 [Methylococcus capsulatus str. Bath]|uniref:DUF7210 domain-containing protein n=1 Tax=Methylococcus capsulatus (strain ATCC 33009 / NCIMB 11132 / Bath) TaxID=243233 RepID=Q603Y0_METCA|nr:hypothetical protein [Methylococcus capsulatus]AAU91187.1 hypothetical protein MCA2666 [Methylococcus capsulatus str. Bath]
MTALVLTRSHTHAGKPYAPGDRIEVDVATADWLIAHDIAKPGPAAPVANPDTTPEPKPLQRKEPKP